MDNSSEGTGHPTGITLRRAGYYTIPTLDELAGLVDDQGRCIVDNFTVGRLNYGNIFYPDSFDVSGLNLDEIGMCTCILYIRTILFCLLNFLIPICFLKGSCPKTTLCLVSLGMIKKIVALVS